VARTTPAAVQAILNRDYDPAVALDPFVETASAVVDDLIALAATDGLPAIPAARAELIERWVAADCYAQNDRLLKSKTTLRSGGSFALGKDERPYLTYAIGLDPTNQLAAVLEGGAAARAFWGGKNRNAATPYTER
jgi:hypothetical protein